MRRLTLAYFLLLAVGGCGGGTSGGMSLQQQHQQALQINDARSRAIRLLQIAYRRSGAGDVQGAQDSVAAAAAAARAIANKNEKAETLASVAYAAGEVGWLTQAGVLVKELRSAIEQAENKAVAAAAMAKMAAVYGKHLNNPTAAEAYLKQAEETASQIALAGGSATTLLTICGRYHELGKKDDAQRTADAALDLARSVEDPRRRAETLAEAGLRLQRIGQAEQSQSVFDEAEAAADAIAGNEVSRAHAFLTIADKLQSAGLFNRAAKVLQKVEDIAYQIPSRGEQEPVLTQLSRQRGNLP